METLRIGTITSPVGIKGEVNVFLHTDQSEVFDDPGYVLIDQERRLVKSWRIQKKMAVLKLDGIEDRNTAEEFKNKDLYIYRRDAPPLPEDTYYVKDLIGLIAIDDEKNELGRLIDVIKGPGQDLYQVENGEGKRFLVPAVEEFIGEIDLERGTIRMNLIEGLDDL